MRKSHDVIVYRVGTRRTKRITTLNEVIIDPDDEVACTHLLRKVAEDRGIPAPEVEIEIYDRKTRKKTRVQG